MSYKVLKAVWGTQSGYVFVPRRKPIPGAKDKWDEGKAFKYPEEWKAIEKRVTESTLDGWDTYWCPLVFKEPSRLKESVKDRQAILWADLDYVDPKELETLSPSIAWESSNGRYQCLWALDTDEDTERIEQVNRDLTYHIGADKGGWDITQVLRVPGSMNYKYNPPQQGKLLWAKKKIFELERVAEVVKAADVEVKTDSLSFLLEGWEVPARTLDLLNVEDAEVEVGERSDRLWEIETSLLDAGMPVLRVVDIISKCPWNKFKGRRGEMEQIYREVLKADEYVKSKTIKKTALITLDPEAKRLKEQAWAIPFGTFMVKDIEKPKWLVEGIWQKGTYGMIAGEPKTYKSVQATDLALSVASGKPFLNYFPVHTRGAVLYVQEENNEQTVQDRIYKIASSKGLLTSTSTGWSLPEDLPLYFSNNYGINLTDPESRKLLEQTIIDINPVLIILDPLYMMLGTVDENSAKEVGDVLRWLTYIRNQYGCSLLICHHYNKGGTNARGGQRVRGSSAFHAWVESAIYVKATTELYTVNIEREFRSFPSLPELQLTIEMGKPGELSYATKVSMVTKTEDFKYEVEKELKVDDLCTVLSASPRTFKELEVLTKTNKRVLIDTLQVLMAEGKIEAIKSTVGRKGIEVYRMKTEEADEYGEDEISL